MVPAFSGGAVTGSVRHLKVTLEGHQLQSLIRLTATRHLSRLGYDLSRLLGRYDGNNLKVD